MQRELVCFCFAPLVYSVMVIGFVFFPLIVVTAPAYACAVGQFMLSATMKIVRLSSSIHGWMDGWMDGWMRKGAQFSSWQITSTAHRTCVCGRSHDYQGKENKTSHHHRTNKRAQSEHKQVHAACNTNTFCAISKSLIQSHAAIENRHANNTQALKLHARVFCVSRNVPLPNPCDLTFGMFLSVPMQHA